MDQTQVLWLIAMVVGSFSTLAILATFYFLWDFHRFGPVRRWLERMDMYWEKIQADRT